MKKHKSLLSLLLVFLTAVIISSCSFNKEDSDWTVEDKSYNVSVEKLKTSGIPIVEITYSTESGAITKEEWKKDTKFKISGSFCNEDDFEDTIEIKGRGNSSWRQHKKPYAIKLSSKNELLGMKKHKRWVLIANYSDKTLLRNYFASQLGKDIYNHEWNPSFKSVHLIMNGEYRGVYLLGEAIKIDKNRVNIPDISDDPDNGGFIFELNERMDEDFNFETTHKLDISLKEPDEVSKEIQEKVRTIIQTAEDALYSSDFDDPQKGYAKYYDVDSFIDWYLVNELAKNMDAADFSSIFYHYDPADGLIHMGPNWDFDVAFGNVYYKNCDYPTELYIKQGNIWLHRMFKDPNFKKRVKARWNETKDDVYRYITVVLQEDADYLSKAAVFNFKKWRGLGHWLWPNPTGATERKTYQSEVDWMIDWLKKRYDYLDKSFNEW